MTKNKATNLKTNVINVGTSPLSTFTHKLIVDGRY